MEEENAKDTFDMTTKTTFVNEKRSAASIHIKSRDYLNEDGQNHVQTKSKSANRKGHRSQKIMDNKVCDEFDDCDDDLLTHTFLGQMLHYRLQSNEL